jgi:hypothetical protein
MILPADSACWGNVWGTSLLASKGSVWDVLWSPKSARLRSLNPVTSSYAIGCSFRNNVSGSIPNTAHTDPPFETFTWPFGPNRNFLDSRPSKPMYTKESMRQRNNQAIQATHRLNQFAPPLLARHSLHYSSCHSCIVVRCGFQKAIDCSGYAHCSSCISKDTLCCTLAWHLLGTCCTLAWPIALREVEPRCL